MSGDACATTGEQAIPRFALRSADAGRRLDLFLVCAVASVLGNRVFLIITGYPQLGNGTLHISHAIWGALMMAIAIIFAISFLRAEQPHVHRVHRRLRLRLVHRRAGQVHHPRRQLLLPADDRADLLRVRRDVPRVPRHPAPRRSAPTRRCSTASRHSSRPPIGELSEPRRAAAMSLLDADRRRRRARAPGARAPRRRDGAARPEPNRFRAVGPIGASVVPAASTQPPLVRARRHVVVRRRRVAAARRRGVARARPRRHPRLRGVGDRHLERGRRARSSSSAWCGCRHHRLSAYRWFERGMLVQIFVTQVFEFAQQQLAGVFGLVVNIADLDGDPFDDPRRGRAGTRRAAANPVGASVDSPDDRAGEAEPRRARGQVGGPLGGRRHVPLRPHEDARPRSTPSTRRRPR